MVQSLVLIVQVDVKDCTRSAHASCLHLGSPLSQDPRIHLAPSTATELLSVHGAYYHRLTRNFVSRRTLTLARHRTGEGLGC